MEKNPEQGLIDLIASQIEDDERILDGLGGGTLSLEELESWRQRRWQAERRFLSESGALIGEMRAKGFGRMMRPSKRQTFGAAYKRSRVPSRAKAARPGQERRKDAAGTRPYHFSLSLSDLGLPCSLRVEGGYDDVLDAALWHARHVHRMKGSPASMRDTIKSAIVEDQVPASSIEERTYGLRAEEQVSNEAANQTRTRGFRR